MKTSFQLCLFSLIATSVAATAQAQSTAPTTPSASRQYAQQGWTDDVRQTFYTTNQGSHMIPYIWFKALQRLDVNEPFGGDQLRRYGYLPNDKSKLNPEGLPVGFVIDGDAKTGDLGMTCAACHTAQIEYKKDDGTIQQLRIDGAPATANFQLFLTDLTEAVQQTLNDPARYATFAHAVLGPLYTATRRAMLKTDLSAWFNQWNDFMSKSLPASPWGPGRLDAFGMIFNRVAARDLGIDANYKVADAPVSYPFLWNASRQDKTQWNGGVPNGLYIHALGRNSGEVFGVFADFKPRKLGNLIDYSKSSVNFRNLQLLEEKIAVLQAPPWPLKVNQDLVARGRDLFKNNCSTNCHEQKDSRVVRGAWATPVQDVKTDSRMFDKANSSTSDPGILKGGLIPNTPGQFLANPAKTHDILANAVVFALLNDAFLKLPPIPNPRSGVWLAVNKDLSVYLPNAKAPLILQLLNPKVLDALRTQIQNQLAGMFTPPNPNAPPAYEARVLYGIWATAPYLHNGSVPNLWELLTPPAQRKSSFMVGSMKYDVKNVGYNTEESPFKDGNFVVNAAINSGNSNAGHDFGTALSDDDKWALIEYLKQIKPGD
jgi:RoxA-like, cytochrome c-like